MKQEITDGYESADKQVEKPIEPEAGEMDDATWLVVPRDSTPTDALPIKHIEAIDLRDIANAIVNYGEQTAILSMQNYAALETFVRDAALWRQKVLVLTGLPSALYDSSFNAATAFAPVVAYETLLGHIRLANDAKKGDALTKFTHQPKGDDKSKRPKFEGADGPAEPEGLDD